MGWVSAFDLLQFVNQNRILGLIADLMDVYVADNAFLVDDDNRTFREALSSKDVIFQRDRAVRPEIAQERIGNPTQRFRESLVGKNGVNADAQDLGIEPVEFGKVFLIRRQLERSDRCERERVKRQHHVLLAFKARQRDFGVEM